MKIFSEAQIEEASAITIKKNNVTTTDLMEHAGVQLFNWLHMRMQGAQVPIYIFCGIGNNGGCGLVLARHLLHHGYNVHIYVVNLSDKRSKDFLINYDRVKEFKVWPTLLKTADDLPQINRDDIIVDAIFGVGLNRKPETWVKDIMKHLNTCGAFIVSVDVPSGLYPHEAPEDKEAIIESNYTLTFQAPKLSFFLPETGIYLQQWEPLAIGLDPEYLYTVPVEAQLLDKPDVLPLYVPRQKYSHKGTYGHGLIIGGSYGKIGAVTLASSACLKVGAGLVTALIPECGYTALQASLPEAMVITDDDKYIEKISFDIAPNSVAIGVGLGTHEKTVKAIETFLKGTKSPLIIDADALNILAKHTALLDLIPELSVLTPHPKELERLIGTWKDDFDKLEKTKAFAKKYKVVVLIKGAHSIVVYDEKLYINNTGNPGMATAGSGDVLTGMITGLFAQGYDPLQATIFATYLHGKAGDLAVLDLGYQAITASTIIDYIGEAYIDLFKQPEQPQQQEEA